MYIKNFSFQLRHMKLRSFRDITEIPNCKKQQQTIKSPHSNKNTSENFLQIKKCLSVFKWFFFCSRFCCFIFRVWINFNASFPSGTYARTRARHRIKVSHVVKRMCTVQNRAIVFIAVYLFAKRKRMAQKNWNHLMTEQLNSMQFNIFDIGKVSAIKWECLCVSECMQAHTMT